MSEIVEPRGATLYTETFADENLADWHHEGIGRIAVVRSDTGENALRLDCTGGRQGGRGCHAFCRREFPDGIAIEYDLLVHRSNGLVIAFVGMRGLNGEDFLADFPPREGLFREYVGDDAPMRSYHVSVSRYDDEGIHTGVSNWRRNPGLHLMAQGPDLCREVGRRYAIRIVKDGPRCALMVDGRVAHAFIDPRELPDEIPTAGRIGFRAIGTLVVADIGNFTVRALR